MPQIILSGVTKLIHTDEITRFDGTVKNFKQNRS